ncbi:hypothetical protein POVWA1_036970 [Plasmodium ovale wallikeri]|uniref:Uncharacterized protein n=1 Tax=Plasmodium ovale wallikeri TaxID=864142 RepID=A0A1A8Z2C6_PLAOA|nr:hypothetical protein POVWA1_036970 [Plasmodium ovale wallikeri]
MESSSAVASTHQRGTSVHLSIASTHSLPLLTHCFSSPTASPHPLLLPIHCFYPSTASTHPLLLPIHCFYPSTASTHRYALYSCTRHCAPFLHYARLTSGSFAQKGKKQLEKKKKKKKKKTYEQCRKSEKKKKKSSQLLHLTHCNFEIWTQKCCSRGRFYHRILVVLPASTKMSVGNIFPGAPFFSVKGDSSSSSFCLCAIFPSLRFRVLIYETAFR